jgi:lipoprotein-anchoring transpeptidase ErfK/SrfK
MWKGGATVPLPHSTGILTWKEAAMPAKPLLSTILNRRAVFIAAASSLVSACTIPARLGVQAGGAQLEHQRPDESDRNYLSMYSALMDEGYQIPAVPVDAMDRRYLRQIVPDPTGERPGTIVVDTSSHFLYLVREKGEALRYGVGLGRAGFEWSGRAIVQWKRKWPKWTPPATMIAREPQLVRYSAANGGMAPGLHNPLGARALYIFQNGEDTLYRLHGTPEWHSIGKSVSSGCVRLMQQDVVDLYDRVPNRTPILVV